METTNKYIGSTLNFLKPHPSFSRGCEASFVCPGRDSERFTFTAKERDEETGYNYFGERYYDCDVTGLFISVDPLTDRCPNISPYTYCIWNPVRLVDPDGNFPFLKHGNIVWKASKSLGLSITNRIKMWYGASIKADIIDSKVSEIHMDGYNNSKTGLHSPSEITTRYNQAIEDYNSSMANGDFVSAGESLHTIADFYSHSNYIELYAKYAYDNGLSTDINDIPSFSEAQQNKDLMSFLEGRLKTGCYPGDKKIDKDNTHSKMNLDHNRGRGKDEYVDDGPSKHEAAFETAKKETYKIINETQ